MTASSPSTTAAPAGPEAPRQTVSLYERWKRIHPLWVSGGWQTWRRVVLAVLVVVFYVNPWLRWNGYPGVRFDLVHRQFTVFWTTFVPEEFVLLAWVMLIAALVLFTVTVAAGRVFCGWACPQTVWTFVYFTIERFIEGDRTARMRLERGGWTLERLAKKALKLSIWAAIALSISITFLGYFEDLHELLPRILRFDLSKWEKIVILLPALGSFVGSAVLREQVCFHMCPYARFQSVMFDHDTLIISYDEARGEPRGHRRREVDYKAEGLGACVDCHKCVQVCPTGIDIRKGLQYQCIGCAACIDACTDVMASLGYGKSLVNYTSQNRQAGKKVHVLRPRLIGYSSLILVLLGLFTFALDHRTPVHLTVIRDRNRLYRERWDGEVENVYTLRIQNRAKEPRDYRVVVASELAVAYVGPEVVEVAAGSLASIPVRLVLDGEHAASAVTSEVRFGLRSVAEGTVEGEGIAIDEASRFYLPTRSAP
ncbi:MAG: cytochrome c oxidase accessory protein CcoG [Deltaproteobacteria bacterium]|nr:cytochrome c oxidase accessory protein CcoG [Deltaproteobacteria bacterium]